MEVSIQSRGLARLKAKLGAIPPAVQLAAERHVATAAMRVQRDAKTAAPVDTGRLRNSIATEIEGLRARVGTNVEYAPFVEFGTRRMRPRPFLVPAAEQERGRFQGRMARLVRKAIREAAVGSNTGGRARDESGRFLRGGGDVG